MITWARIRKTTAMLTPGPNGGVGSVGNGTSKVQWARKRWTK